MTEPKDMERLREVLANFLNDSNIEGIIYFALLPSGGEEDDSDDGIQIKGGQVSFEQLEAKLFDGAQVHDMMMMAAYGLTQGLRRINAAKSSENYADNTKPPETGREGEKT